MFVGNAFRNEEKKPEPFEIEDFTAMLAVIPERPPWADQGEERGG